MSFSCGPFRLGACENKRQLMLPVGSSFQLVGLALMIGGMLALGAFTAPVVFGQLPREQAGPIMATIFRRYDIVLLVSLGLVLGGEALRLASRCVQAKSLLNLIRYGFMAVLVGGVLFSTLKLNADIEKMNRAGLHRDYTAAGRAFEKTHKLSETLYKLDMLAALLLLAMTPFAGFREGHEGADG